MDPEDRRILFSRYRRHNACQAETVRAILGEAAAAFPGAAFRAAVCGSGGKPLADAVGAHFIQEVVANAIAVRAFYPQTRAAIELGGQDAKVVFFYYDEFTKNLVASDMRMNGSCAGGTGAFIDEVAVLLRTPVEEFEALAARGKTVYDISGRCGVFAKTDIQPLLNQGGQREDIALSALHAIVKQTIGGLAQGLELKAPIIFEGGPLTFNPTLIRVFAEWLGLKGGDIIRPENPEILIAQGAALSLDGMFAHEEHGFCMEAALSALADYRGRLETAGPAGKLWYFDSPEERRRFEERHLLPAPPGGNFPRKDVLRVYLGIDAGSTTTKFALLDEDEEVVDSFYANNRGDPLQVIKEALLDLKKKYDDGGVRLDIIALGTTGYGELLFNKALGADYHTVETVAHAEAARKYVPGVSFILDIGGQDMKAISISPGDSAAPGIVTNITLNEACSSGCGSFLENFAAGLNIPVEGIAEAAFRAANPAELGSRCTVFMNSTIITEQKNGKQADDIMAGLCRSIIENVFTKVIRVSNLASLGDRIVVQGGTFRNDAVLRALEQYLGKEVVRAPYPGEMGAIGIALLTKKQVSARGFGPAGRSRFIGLEAVKDFGYVQRSNVKCTICANNCGRTLVTFSNGVTWVTGNRCERGELVGDPEDASFREQVRDLSRTMGSVPDLIKFREKLLFRDYPCAPVAPPRGTVIGLPRVLDFWRTMPFFTTFFRVLGFKTVLSGVSSRKLYEKGLQYVASDTVCFPAKLAHGHLQDLIEKRVDRIFMPLLSLLPTENREPLSVYTCPVLKGYPLVLKYSNNPERKSNIPLDTPVFHWYREGDRDYQLCRYMRETFGTPEAFTRQAIAQGDRAMASFRRELAAEGSRVIAEAEAQGKFVVVVAGRHYQFDELVNHNLSRHFTGLGIPVLPVDALEGLRDEDLSRTMPDINNSNHALLLAGALIAARRPSLEYVEIFSFGCGHDAIYTDEVTRILSEVSGKAPLILKLDESDVTGPLRIRIRSFVETVETRRREAAGPGRVRSLGDPYPVKYHRKAREKVILVPNTSRAFCKLMTAAIRKQGFRAAPLPLGGREAMVLGKRYVHNDICFPAQMVIGEALAALKSGEYDPDEVAIGTGKVYCDCRLVNYLFLTRRALDDAGYPQVPIISTDVYDVKNAHPGFKLSELSFARVAWCSVMIDILEGLRRKIRPYELERGETDRVFEGVIDRITDALRDGGMIRAYRAYRRGIDDLRAVRYDRGNPKPPVYVTGEYLMVFHQGANYHLEDYLERNGMEVILPRMYDVYRNLMLTHTVSKVKDFHVRLPPYEVFRSIVGDKFFGLAQTVMEIPARRHPLFRPAPHLPELAKLSDPLVHHSIQSGEGHLMAAEIMHHAEMGVKSFVILQPFGCLPNHVYGRGIIKRIKELYPAIQILPLDYDPDTSFANIENRLQMLVMNARAAGKAAEGEVEEDRKELIDAAV
jgi:predicted CoA-substrate-specific enzyme activase